MTRAPACYTRPRALTPNIRRWMQSKGWLDHRIVTRIERPTPEAAALAYRIRQLEDAPGAGVDERA